MTIAKAIEDILNSLPPNEAEAALKEMRLYGSFVLMVANDGATKRLPLQTVSWRDDGAREVGDDEAYASAVAVMDRAFGIGIKEAHAVLRSDAAAKRIYDCAIAALVQQMSARRTGAASE